MFLQNGAIAADSEQLGNVHQTPIAVDSRHLLSLPRCPLSTVHDVISLLKDMAVAI